MGNGLPHASAASFAQIVRQAIQLLFEFWLQPYPNRHDRKVLNNLFNSLAVGRWFNSHCFVSADPAQDRFGLSVALHPLGDS